MLDSAEAFFPRHLAQGAKVPRFGRTACRSVPVEARPLKEQLRDLLAGLAMPLDVVEVGVAQGLDGVSHGRGFAPTEFRTASCWRPMKSLQTSAGGRTPVRASKTARRRTDPAIPS